MPITADMIGEPADDSTDKTADTELDKGKRRRKRKNAHAARRRRRRRPRKPARATKCRRSAAASGGLTRPRGCLFDSRRVRGERAGLVPSMILGLRLACADVLTRS